MSAPAPELGECPHCGAAVEGADAFCCSGCELAAAIISGAGLQGYYTERDAPAPRPEPIGADWSAVELQRSPTGEVSCRLVVDKLRCASCVWVVEGVLRRTEGVDRATVSYATGRATVTFDPQVIELGDLARRIAALGYRPRPVDAAPDHDHDLLTRLGVAAFCTGNVMLLAASLYAGWWTGMEERYAALFRWTSLALATPVALWSAAPFFASAWRGLTHRVLHMDLPISLAVAILYVHGLLATLWGLDAYLDSLTMLVTLLLAGRVIEARGRRSAVAAAAQLAASLPTVARRVTDAGLETVSVDRLKVGDRVEVGLGEEIPADGRVLAGHARVRMALLTGESEPIAVSSGDPVVAGAPLVQGAVTVEVTRVGADTLGQRMARQLQVSVDQGLPTTPADRIAPWFVVATVAVALASLLVWAPLAGGQRGLEVMVSVLVVACPCALGLSWPVAVGAGLAAAARRGLVLTDGATLLRLAQIEQIALDKTGTVTGGRPRVIDADRSVLRIAAGLERASTHPVASAIRDAATEAGIALPQAHKITETPGQGIRGEVDGVRWSLEAGEAGEIRLVGPDGPAGVLRLADAPRDDAPQAVARLMAWAPVALLTGDHPDVAQAQAAAVGVEEVHPRMTPEDKVAWIQDHGRVLFVGDGLNDGPALVAAHVGLAMQDGAATTLLAADGVVVQPSLGPVVAGLRTARVVHAAVQANLIRSVLYNVAAVSLAAAGLVDPLVAAVSMPLSSLVVLWGGTRIEHTLSREEPWTSS
ncbi:MAG TPA: cadmium-translocating P-type ATPase [Deltaproteobacteria bacterium]|nr:cadmium-translocating P-type ATPase [Deltaproteobacteria bacterium]